MRSKPKPSWWKAATPLARLAVASLALVVAGCAEQEEPRTAHEVDPCAPPAQVGHAAETAGSAVETGATTAWEGMKTFGTSVGGFVEGGSAEAKKKWQEGADKTRKTAREGATDTEQTAAANPCPER